MVCLLVQTVWVTGATKVFLAVLQAVRRFRHPLPGVKTLWHYDIWEALPYYNCKILISVIFFCICVFRISFGTIQNVLFQLLRLWNCRLQRDPVSISVVNQVQESARVTPSASLIGLACGEGTEHHDNFWNIPTHGLRLWYIYCG
jgi:hypothetical protein